MGLGSEIMELFVQLITLTQQAAAEDVTTTIITTAIRAGVAISVTFLAYLVISRLIETYGQKNKLEKRQTRQVKTFFKYIILAFGLVALIYALGLDPAVVLASAGVAGFALSFAAKDIISNFLSGLFLIFGKTIVVNDVVKIEDIYGVVRLVSMRTTEIKTFDGNIVTVPNSTMVNSNIINMTSGSKFMLTSVVARIGYNEDLNIVINIMENAMPDDDRIHIENKSDLFFEFQDMGDDRVLGHKVIMYFKVDALQEPWIR